MNKFYRQGDLTRMGAVVLWLVFNLLLHLLR